ncbi:MAG: hypothetical protein AAF541_08315 [Pseudomonadota bacterium]
MNSESVDKSPPSSADKPAREVVYFFDATEAIGAELRLSDFLKLARAKRIHPFLKARAASLVRAAYCVVGNEHELGAIVFFQFQVEDSGRLNAKFNLPLAYLARQAGRYENSGMSLRKASRGQCPVPWHAVNLWEPESAAVIDQVQAQLQANALKLPAQVFAGEDDFFDKHDCDSGIELTPLSDFQPENIRPIKPAPQDYSDRLHQVFGPSGKLSMQDMIRMHAEQLDELRDEFQREIQVQQLTYLDQIRLAQEEIAHLKIALKQEQGRNHRLQQMLRGDL